MSQIRFINGTMLALDRRVPVTLIHVDKHGTATIEDYEGRRHFWGVDKLQPAECYVCKGMTGEMTITPYGSIGRLRCVHAGPCEK